MRPNFARKFDRYCQLGQSVSEAFQGEMISICPITGRTEWRWSKPHNFALDKILGHGISVVGLSDTEDWKIYKENAKKTRKSGTNRRELMLFSETGRRSKDGQRFHGDKFENIRFNFSVFKKRSKPATCRWRAKCCLCESDKVSPRPLNIRRKSTYISEYRLAQSFTRLGHMSTNKLAGFTAHYYCMYYASGEGMLQNFKLKPEEYLEGFPVTEILKNIDSARTKKCSYCGKTGAASECAKLNCIKEGFYHFPCGLENKSYQTVNKTYCVKHGEGKQEKVIAKEIRKGGRKPGSKKKEQINDNADQDSPTSSQESMSLLLDDQTANQQYVVEQVVGEKNKIVIKVNQDKHPDPVHHPVDPNDINQVLEPICFLDIVAELEASEDLDNSIATNAVDDIDDTVFEKDQTTGTFDQDSSNIMDDSSNYQGQDTEEYNQPSSPFQSQDNFSGVEALQKQLEQYEALLEKSKQENEEMEERHRNDLAYKQASIDNLEQKLKREKETQKALLDGKKIQIDHVKRENARLLKEKQELHNKIVTLQTQAKKRDNLEMKSKNLQISELMKEKAQLVQRLRFLGNQLLEEAARNEPLGNEYIEESFPENKEAEEDLEIKRTLEIDIKEEFDTKKQKLE